MAAGGAAAGANVGNSKQAEAAGGDIEAPDTPQHRPSCAVPRQQLAQVSQGQRSAAEATEPTQQGQLSVAGATELAQPEQLSQAAAPRQRLPLAPQEGQLPVTRAAEPEQQEQLPEEASHPTQQGTAEAPQQPEAQTPAGEQRGDKRAGSAAKGKPAKRPKTGEKAPPAPNTTGAGRSKRANAGQNPRLDSA